MKQNNQKLNSSILKRLFYGLAMVLLLSSSSGLAYQDNLLDWTHRYYKVLRKNTKTSVKYNTSDIDAKYRLYATYHSQKFKKAFQKYFNRYYPEGQNGKAGEHYLQQSASEQSEFFVALYAKQISLRELKNPQGFWSVKLHVGNQSFDPVLLEKVPRDAYYKKFYPYLDNWYQGYRVVFPYNAYQSKEPMTLVISSVAGISQLEFKP